MLEEDCRDFTEREIDELTAEGKMQCFVEILLQFLTHNHNFQIFDRCLSDQSDSVPNWFLREKITYQVDDDMRITDRNSQPQSLMNTEIIAEIIPSIVQLRIEPGTLSRSFDIAVVDIKTQTRL